jgi:hypothetical protein
LRIGIRNQGAERVIAAAEIEDDEVAPRLPLRNREL